MGKRAAPDRAAGSRMQTGRVRGWMRVAPESGYRALAERGPNEAAISVFIRG